MPHKAALIGNPNCGKTLLFNLLTGSNQKVANFPGITVDKKSGTVLHTDIELVDLPGIYSLSSYSSEEKVTRDFILDENPDMIVNIVDGTNIERNLYLTLQLLELSIPMVVVVNMADQLERLHIVIEYEKLSNLLGAPVIPISAKKQKNIEKVIEALHSYAHHIKMGSESHPACPVYTAPIMALKQKVSDLAGLGTNFYDFYGMKLLERDANIHQRLELPHKTTHIIEDTIVDYIKDVPNHDEDTFVADERYHYIDKISAEVLQYEKHVSMHKRSDRIDAVLMHRVFAIPLFLLIMCTIFMITFGGFGQWLQALITDGLGALGTWSGSALTQAGAPLWFISLLVDGILAGVGGVLEFLPQIVILFSLLTVLEDTGYMSRVAFIMDKLLRTIGLSGKAFIPMLLGFGCTTPAVMAARTLDNDKDRRMTILLTPFMSCSAKMPIYLMFAGIFFKGSEGLVMSAMYALGIVLAVLVAFLFKNTVFKGVQSPFVLELPPYRVPSGKSIGKQIWEKTSNFLVRAGTIIFAMSIVLWMLQHFTPAFVLTTQGSDSILAMIGRGIAPIFAPMGFGHWEASVALLAGLAGKEVVVSSLQVLLPAGGIGSLFTAQSAVSFMVFTLLYIPCTSAFITMNRELRSAKWSAFLIAFQLGFAYLISLLAYWVMLLIL